METHFRPKGETRTKAIKNVGEKREKMTQTNSINRIIHVSSVLTSTMKEKETFACTRSGNRLRKKNGFDLHGALYCARRVHYVHAEFTCAVHAASCTSVVHVVLTRLSTMNKKKH